MAGLYIGIVEKGFRGFLGTWDVGFLGGFCGLFFVSIF